MEDRLGSEECCATERCTIKKDPVNRGHNVGDKETARKKPVDENCIFDKHVALGGAALSRWN